MLGMVMLEIKILCQCIFNDGGFFVESTRVSTCLVSQFSYLISGRMMSCSVGVMLLQMSRW